MTTASPEKNQEFDVLLNKSFATEGSHRKAGAFKDSQFWLNKLQSELNTEEFGQLAQYSLVARYRQVNSYDQVSRNPGEFGTDCSNRYVESLGFPPPEFYELMKHPDVNKFEIDEILRNIPDEIIDMFAPWYDDFMNNEDDTALNNKGNVRSQEKFDELKKKQFLALAAFGAITWGANKYIDNPEIAQRVKGNIIKFKNDHPESFNPFMEKLDKARENKEKIEAGKNPPPFRDKVAKVHNEENKKEANEIRAYNDPFYNNLSKMKDRAYTLATSDKYGLTQEQKQEFQSIHDQVSSLLSKVEVERSTGVKLSEALTKEIKSTMGELALKAAKLGNEETLALCISIADVATVKANGGTMLVDVLQGNSPSKEKMTTLLIEHGANPKLTTTNYSRKGLTAIGDAFKSFFKGNFKNMFKKPPRTPSEIAGLNGDIALEKMLKDKEKEYKEPEKVEQKPSIVGEDSGLLKTLQSTMEQSVKPGTSLTDELVTTKEQQKSFFSKLKGKTTKEKQKEPTIDPVQTQIIAIDKRLSEIKEKENYKLPDTHPYRIALVKEEELLSAVRTELGKVPINNDAVNKVIDDGKKEMCEYAKHDIGRRLTTETDLLLNNVLDAIEPPRATVGVKSGK